MGYVSFLPLLRILYVVYEILTICRNRYAFNADDLVNDFVSLTSLVTKESLQNLEASYNQSQGVPTGISFPQMQAAASRFLGRLWAGSNSHNSVKSLNPNNSPSRPNSTIRRSTSKQSMTSTLNSVESSSDASTAPTELSSATTVDGKARVKSNMSAYQKDRDLHTQIEDLLMALTDLQRQNSELSMELQQEREEREEDHSVAKEMLNHLQQQTEESQPTELVLQAQARFAPNEPKHASITQTKHQLHDDMVRWKEMHELEAGRCVNLTRRMDEFEKENTSLKDELREARGRIQEGYRDKQRLERMNTELRSLKIPPTPKTPPEINSPDAEVGSSKRTSPQGLRELRLVRSNSTKTPTYSKRTSSLGLQSVLATEKNKPAPEEALLLELVGAKTAEAVAKQELEEVKAKLDSLRKMISAAPSQPGPKAENRSSFIGRSPSRASIVKASTEPVKTPAASTAGAGGFFSGWGRRAAPSAEQSG